MTCEHLGYRCEWHKVCPHLEDMDYQCPVIEIAREYDAIITGKKQAPYKFYGLEQTGIDPITRKARWTLMPKTKEKL